MRIELLERAFSYEGNEVTFRDENGHVKVNATQMAKPFGKRPVDYLNLPSTKEFIDVIVRYSNKLDIQEDEVVITKTGPLHKGGGTWMCEELALDFAQWLSPDFRMWCTLAIKKLINEGEVSLKVKDSEKENFSNYSMDEYTRSKMVVVEGLANMLGMNDVSKLALVQANFGYIDVNYPDYAKAADATLSATDLLDQRGIKMQTKDFNKKLESAGIIEKMTRSSSSSKSGFKSFWKVTDYGLKFGENFAHPNNPRETHPRWYVNKFDELLNILGIKEG